jgi:hypothetical protein
LESKNESLISDLIENELQAIKLMYQNKEEVCFVQFFFSKKKKKKKKNEPFFFFLQNESVEASSFCAGHALKTPTTNLKNWKKNEFQTSPARPTCSSPPSFAKGSIHPKRKRKKTEMPCFSFLKPDLKVPNLFFLTILHH